MESSPIKLLSLVWDKLIIHLSDTDMWGNVGFVILKIIAIIILFRISMKIAKRMVDGIFRKRQSRHFQMDARRINTLRTLMHNTIDYTGNFIMILLILSQIDIKLGPLLAGAGVVGLAIGFGAQNLVRDIITGFFIIFEDQFGVGDYITTGNFSGTVEQIGLRITKIKGVTGEIHIIPNGSIVEVTNFSTSNAIAIVDVGIAYEENIEKAVSVLKEIVKETAPELDMLVGEPIVLGVQQLGASEILLRVTAECLPMQQYHVERVLRANIKKGFDEHGIEIPYPKMVTYHKEEKSN